MDKSGRINLRLTPSEKESWEAAAGGARNLSSWLRGLANNAAREIPSFEIAPYIAPKAAKNQCPRWMHHRPGVYCGSCTK